jgi:CBS domain-containing protein
MTDRPVHVRDVLDPDVTESLKPGDRLGDVLENIVGRFRLNSIPVVESDRLVGVLRVKRFMAAFYAQEGGRTTRRAVLKYLAAAEVSDLMETPPVRLHPGDTLNRAAEVMLTTGWHEIPVTDQRRKFKGVLTARDLVRAQLRKMVD